MKNIEGPSTVYINEATQYARLRLEAANLISLANKKDKKAMTQYAKLLQGIDLSDNAKSNPKLPLAKGIPLSALAFYFGDLEKSSEILETITDAASYAVYNNRGIFELLKGRYSSALLHFSKALNARHNNELVYPFHRVAYNMGLSLLFKGKPKRAFKYLHSIIPLMKDSPFLWLRLAECIVMYYKQRIAKLRRKTQLSPVVAQKLCTARQTFYVLPATDVKVFETDTKKTPDMTLSFAANCAKNCIALCKPNQTDVKDRAQMVCSFICLELGDGKNANEMGKSVSQGLSFEHQFLAKIYAAQGVMMNGYYEEASKVLSRLLVESSFSQEKEQNTLNNLTLARVFMKIGETKKAESQLSRAAEPDPRRPEVVLTNVWVDIQRKHTTQAIQEIKEYSETSLLHTHKK